VSDSAIFINFPRFSTFFFTANGKRSIEGITGQSLVIFTNNTPVQNLGPAPLKLKKILDMAPITVTDSTPMETVVDMFRKLGLRQTLVTHNG
jgi:chloride channel 3/4/5